MNNITFGKLIAEKRKALGWSQDLLAEKTGLSQGSISRIENGTQSNLLESNKRALLEALEIKEGYDTFSSCNVDCSPEMQEWCRKVKKILESKAKNGEALKEIIDAFLMSVEAKEEAKREIEEFKTNVQAQIDTLKLLHDQEIDKLNLEWNKKLEQKFEDHQKKFGDKGLRSDTGTDEDDGTQK